MGVEMAEETAGFSGEPGTYANRPTLGTTTRTAAGGAPVTDGKWVK